MSSTASSPSPASATGSVRRRRAASPRSGGADRARRRSSGRQSRAARGAGARRARAGTAARALSADQDICRSRRASAAVRPTRRRRLRALAARQRPRGRRSPRRAEAARATGRRRPRLPRSARARDGAASAIGSGPPLRLAPLPAVLVNPRVAVADAAGFRGARAGARRRRRAAPRRPSERERSTATSSPRCAQGRNDMQAERGSDRARDHRALAALAAGGASGSRACRARARPVSRSTPIATQPRARRRGCKARAAGMVGAGDLSSLVARVAGFDGSADNPSGIGRARRRRLAWPRRPLALTRRSRARSPRRCPGPTPMHIETSA